MHHSTSSASFYNILAYVNSRKVNSVFNTKNHLMMNQIYVYNMENKEGRMKERSEMKKSKQSLTNFLSFCFCSRFIILRHGTFYEFVSHAAQTLYK